MESKGGGGPQRWRWRWWRWSREVEVVEVAAVKSPSLCKPDSSSAAVAAVVGGV